MNFPCTLSCLLLLITYLIDTGYDRKYKSTFRILFRFTAGITTCASLAFYIGLKLEGINSNNIYINILFTAVCTLFSILIIKEMDDFHGGGDRSALPA